MLTTAATTTAATTSAAPARPDLAGVALAAAAAFATGAAWYTAFAGPVARLSDAAAASSSGTLPVEVLRCLVLAAVLAALVARLGVVDPAGALRVALAAWVAFPAVLLLGSVVHEDVPWTLAAIHAGDWLVKLVVVVLLLARRQRRTSAPDPR